MQLLRYMASVLDAGFPLVAFLQLVRVYGQALARIADAEVKLFHLFVHEPLMRDGVAGPGDRRGDGGPRRRAAAARLADHGPRPPPLAAALRRARTWSGTSSSRARATSSAACASAIAFADLAGYTRLTEEAGEEEALDVVERFVESVEVTLPDDARVIKTIGDEVMVVGADPSALVDWAVGFQALNAGRGRCRGSASTAATRCTATATTTAARSTSRRGSAPARPAARCSSRATVVEAAGSHLAFEPIGEVQAEGLQGGDGPVPARAQP